MEAHQLDQRFSDHYKSHIGNPMKTPSIGVLKAPPPSLHHSHRHQTPLPPLLPLPVYHIRRSSTCLAPSRTPVNRNGNGTRHHSLITSKKSTKEEKKMSKRSSHTVTVSSTSNLESKEASKSTVKLPRFASMSKSNDHSVIMNRSSGPMESVEDEEEMLGTVFTVSPPPSSLPLPTFCLRGKHSCIAEAAGEDTGATDNLRRILRLQ